MDDEEMFVPYVNNQALIIPRIQVPVGFASGQLTAHACLNVTELNSFKVLENSVKLDFLNGWNKLHSS